MEIFSYFEDIESDLPHFHSQKRLLELWGDSWAQKGFCPIVLNANTAKKSPYYKRFLYVVQTLFYEIVGCKMPPYEEACWMRWLAYSTLGKKEPFLVCDYDVINNCFPRPSLPANKYFPKGLTIWHGTACPAVASGTSEDYLNMCKSVERVNPEHYRSWLLTKTYKDFHDQIFLNAAVDQKYTLCQIGLQWSYLKMNAQNSIVGHFGETKGQIKQLLHVSTRSSHQTIQANPELAVLNLQEVRYLNALKIMDTEPQLPTPVPIPQNKAPEPPSVNPKKVSSYTYVWTSPKKLGEYSDEEIREFQWYTNMEMRPGVFTQSFFPQKNSPTSVFPVSLIRHLMKNMGVRKGHRCLDFGTMNAALAVLMEKRGAQVVTQDSMPNYYATVNLVQEAYGTNFEYLNDVSIYDLRLSRDDKFDVVLFCGIMYHLINPMIELAIARSFLSPGGLMLIETQSMLSQPSVSSNFFEIGAVTIPSVGFLEHFCRILCLKPIDMVYINGGGTGPNKKGRIAFVCRAVESPALDVGYQNNAAEIHAFYGKVLFTKVNRQPLITKNQFYSMENPSDISYDLSNAVSLVGESEKYIREDVWEPGIDLYKSVQAQPPGTTFVKPKEILHLNDSW